MIPVFMVALACVGVALNILSDNPPLLRHPTVRKLVSDSSRWTQTNARRLLDQQQRAIAATKRVYRDLSDDNWAEARLRVRKAADRLSTLPSRRAQLRVTVPPPRRDVVVYKPFEVQLYEQPASGTCPVLETCPAAPWWPFPATTCDVSSSSLELASVPPTCPLTESPSDTSSPPLPIPEVSRSLRRPALPSSLVSPPGLSAGNTTLQLFGPLPVQESSVLTAVDNTLGGAGGFHWLPAILSGCFVLLAMVLLFPSKRGARLGKRELRKRTRKNVKTSVEQPIPQAESVITTPAALCSVAPGNSGDFTPLVSLGDSSMSCELPLFDDSQELSFNVNCDSDLLYNALDSFSDALPIGSPSPSPSSPTTALLSGSTGSASSADSSSTSPSAIDETATSSSVAADSPYVVDDAAPRTKKRTRRGDQKRRDERKAQNQAKLQALILSSPVPSSIPSSASVPGSATIATSNTSMAPPSSTSSSTAPASLPDATSPAQKPKKRTRRGKRKQQVKIETKVEHVAPVCDIVADDVAPAVSPRSSSSAITSCSNATHAITPATPNAPPSTTSMTTTTAHMAPTHSGVHPLGLRRALANDAVAGSACSSASVPGSSTSTTTASAGSSRAQTPPPVPLINIHDDSPST